MLASVSEDRQSADYVVFLELIVNFLLEQT